MPKTLRTVVTFLEMFKKPLALHVAPPLKNYALLRAEKPPLHYYRYLYHMVGRDYAWVNRKRMSDGELLEIIHHDRVEIYVLYAAGVPAGYFELDFRNSPDVDLVFFGLMPEFSGLGLSRFLLSQAISLAWRGNTKRLQVQTCTLDHARALPLYQRMGFEPFAQEEAELVTIDDRDMIRLTPSR
ncbi:MAG: GNAT family N-acetyltransferase [Alphaproteobacteria bacterium]|nr:GNAT family N-acetyltransferase [Alphaproteobacteria bacterium]